MTDKRDPFLSIDLPLTFFNRLTLTSLTLTSLSSTSPITNAWVIPFLARFIKDAASPIPLKYVAFEFTSSAAVDAEAPLDLSALREVLKSSMYVPKLTFRSTNGSPMWKEIATTLAGWPGAVTFT